MKTEIIGKGHLGVILIRALDMEFKDAQQAVDYIEAYCRRHNYKITVEKIEE